MRVLVVEDEPYMAEAIRAGLRLEAIAADIAGDGDAALELLRINACDIAVLDRELPSPTRPSVPSRDPRCSIRAGRDVVEITGDNTQARDGGDGDDASSNGDV